jgi:hypothetical protein
VTTDARLWHSWLRIQRLLCDILTERWDDETWARIKSEVANALAERRRIERRLHEHGGVDLLTLRGGRSPVGPRRR